MNSHVKPIAEKHPSGNVRPAGSNRLGLVTREMCRTRSRELAEIAGRPQRQVWQADYLQARRELTGETDPDLQDAILDSSAASQELVSNGTWHQGLPANPIASGRKTTNTPGQLFHAPNQ